jgi:uncharacterized protein (DUF488 family)
LSWARWRISFSLVQAGAKSLFPLRESHLLGHPQSLFETTISAGPEVQSELLIYTIGFTQKSAERFFGLLSDAKVERVVDTRIFPNTQLSGFAKGGDLPFFLRRLVGADYEHRTDFAPTETLLRQYRNKEIDWEEYEGQYKALLSGRRIEEHVAPSYFARRTALLCSEATVKRCHRRLLVEYLASFLGPVQRIDL